MADFIDDNFGASSSPVDLNDLIPTTTLPPLPMAATRNRAATTALLSNQNPVENFQLMMNQAQGGDDALIKQGQEIAQADAKATDMKGVMSVLSDPKASLEQKRAAVASISNPNSFLKDSGNLLYTKNLEAPSRGETVEHEDARISGADAIAEIYAARKEIQGLVNSRTPQFKDLMDNKARSAVGVVEANLLPLGNNIVTGQIVNAAQKEAGTSSWFKQIKNYLLPGSAITDIRSQLEGVPPSKRAEFAQIIVKAIQENSDIIIPTDNQYAQYEKANTIFDEGGYSSTAQFIDNVSGLLDIIGVGQFLNSGRKAAKVASKGAQTVEGVGKSKRSTPAPDITDINEPARVGYTPPMAERVPGTAWEPGPIGAAQTEITNQQPRLPHVRDVTPTGGEVGAYRGNGVQGAAQTELANPQQRLANVQKAVDDIQARDVAISRIEVNSVVRNEQPASPGEIINSTNPERARTLNESLVNAPDDQMAKGVYGVTREQAIINNVYPQVDVDGAVLSKVADISQPLRQELHVPEAIVEAMSNQTLIHYTPAERAAARAHVVNSFQNAEGLTMNEAMGGFKVVESGALSKISAVYGNADGPFKSAEQAVEQAKYALRNQGIRDDEITILQRQGLDHVPVDLEDVRGVEGSYLVRVETTHEIGTRDVASWQPLDVKRNALDRIGQLTSEHKGSAARWVMDAASMLHPTITKGASVAGDYTAKFEHIMLQEAAKFTDKYMDLPKASRFMVDDYIKEANLHGIKFDVTDLIARGHTPDEIAAIADWKNFWDGHYYLENYDMVRSLKAQGYSVLDNQGTTLFARPVQKNQNITRVYDPSTNSVVSSSKADGDALYAANGYHAQLRRPITVNGDTVGHIIVRNTPTEYLRGLRDTDKVLNYRDGYYQVTYNSPRFVDQVIRDSNGVAQYTKAIAVAGDTKEATHFADRMAASQGLDRADFTVRGDVRNAVKSEDSHWDLASSGGRIAQRTRGKMLEDAAGINQLGDGSYVRNPVESAIKAAQSISGRTVNRPMLEAAKARAVEQYKGVFPSDGMGGVRWPLSIDEIGKKGVYSSKEIADARTTYEYVNYLENGYHNSMDDMFKAFMNALGEYSGEKGWSLAERAANATSQVNLTTTLKKGVFLSYMAANPLRQFVVQTNQMVRTWAYNVHAPYAIPKYFAEMSVFLFDNSKKTDFTRWLTQTGFMDAVDKHSLVRGSLTSAAEASSRGAQIASDLAHIPQRVGFNAGEQGNMMAHAAAVFDKYKRAGKDVTNKDVMDDMAAEARAISYQMNFAGDMPYNQTSPAMILQFMQVPHKAVLGMTNRAIPFTSRVRMLAGDMGMWGVPGLVSAGTLAGVNLLPDDPETRDYVVNGIQHVVYNQFINKVFDEPGMKSNVDFTAFSPYGLDGWVKFFHGLFKEGLMPTIMNSPAASMYYKEKGASRVQMAANSVMRYFNVIDDHPEDPETFLSMLNEVAKISSGWNNAMKAKLMLETGKKLDAYGAVIDKIATPAEAFAQALGFPTMDSTKMYETSKALGDKTKAHKDAVLEAYRDIKMYYAEKLGTPNTDPKYITAVSGWALQAFKDDPVGMSIIYGEWAKDMVGPEAALMKKMMDAAAIPSPGDIVARINQSPASEEQKAIAIKRVEDFAHMREEINKGNK